MSNEDWSSIDHLLNDLHIVHQGLASSSFVGQIEKRLSEECDSIETIMALKAMVLPEPE